MDLAMRLQRLIEGRGTTIPRLATLIGEPRSTVDRWCKGGTEPKLSQAAKLATALGVTLDELAGLESPTRGVERSPAIEALLAVLSDDEAIRRLGAVPQTSEVRVTIKPTEQRPASKRSG
jgi:transcriptional regulator with XRE-family HTH domain